MINLTFVLKPLLLNMEYVLLYVPKALAVARSIRSLHVVIQSKMILRYFALFTKGIFRPFS
jgi:hypothetical protein